MTDATLPDRLLDLLQDRRGRPTSYETITTRLDWNAHRGNVQKVVTWLRESGHDIRTIDGYGYVYFDRENGA
jgi:biotin operon repressor